MWNFLKISFLEKEGRCDKKIVIDRIEIKVDNTFHFVINKFGKDGLETKREENNCRIIK